MGVLSFLDKVSRVSWGSVLSTVRRRTGLLLGVSLSMYVDDI